MQRQPACWEKIRGKNMEKNQKGEETVRGRLPRTNQWEDQRGAEEAGRRWGHALPTGEPVDKT